MKSFGFYNEGVLAYEGWYKKTLMFFGKPLLSRHLQVMSYKGGGYMKFSTPTSSLTNDSLSE
ncbi:hypothetical protein [uncultured Helicobacter sp.]